MSFLKKILFVVLMGAFIGDSEGLASATLDFNNIVSVAVPPCFQPHSYDAPAAGQLLDHLRNGEKYVYFNVNPASRSTSNASPSPVVNRNPVLGEDNIYFPKDGSQPTTEDAVKWSCANVDNIEDSSITEWYMKMFGVLSVHSDSGNQLIETGFYSVNPTINCPILSCGSINPEDRKQFLDCFKKIASTSVGRVLLYRILIEIRRTKEGQHVAEVPTMTAQISKRNRSLSIKVVSGDQEVPMRYSSGTISFSSQYVIEPSVIKDLVDRNREYVPITKEKSRLDVNLFHEMLHWFHELRNPARYAKESLDDSIFSSEDNYTSAYFDGIEGYNSMPRQGITVYIWEDLEELRTILGVKMGSWKYLYGDDISENLYRVCVKEAVRFGHKSKAFYEDSTVINRYLDTLYVVSKYYVKNDIFDYNLVKDVDIGIGNAKIIMWKN